MKSVCIIPARYASSRLPGKVLLDIAGKTMIQRVYEQALKIKNCERVLIATDDDRVKDICQSFGADIIMTDSNLQSGTDRVKQAIKNIDCDVVINLQADEPFINPGMLEKIIDLFENKDINIATPLRRIDSEADLANPNVVKVIRDVNGYALYFSRASIPFVREKDKNWFEKNIFYKHIGIYAYRRNILKKITELKISSLEKIEKLEQLRFLENGYKIFTLITDYDSISIDTKEDLEKVNFMIKQKVISV